MAFALSSGVESSSKALVADAELLVHAGRFDLAITEFERCVRGQPGDAETAAILADLCLRAGEAAADDGRCSEALAYLSVVANWRVSRGDAHGAAELHARIECLEVADAEAQIELARCAARVLPADQARGPFASTARPTHTPEMKLQASRARASVARGDAVAAAAHLTPGMAEGDPSLLLAIAEIQLRAGRFDQGIALIDRVIADRPSLADAVAQLGIEIARRDPDAGFLLVEMAADVWMARAEGQAAAGAFESFAAHVPGYAPALARLREIEAAAADPCEDHAVVIPFRESRSL